MKHNICGLLQKGRLILYPNLCPFIKISFTQVLIEICAKEKPLVLDRWHLLGIRKGIIGNFRKILFCITRIIKAILNNDYFIFVLGCTISTPEGSCPLRYPVNVVILYYLLNLWIRVFYIFTPLPI